MGEDGWQKWHLSPEYCGYLTTVGRYRGDVHPPLKKCSAAMLFVVILVIALGWAGWFWSWGRNRYVSNAGLGLLPNPLAPRPMTALSPPRTATMARRRRREVLGALALLVMLTFLLARAWSLLWTLQVLVDVSFLAYGWAVLSIERPGTDSRDERAVMRPSLQPVLDTRRHRVQPGPRSNA